MDEVKLPSDELPMEEVRAMNSKVTTYNLNKPMDWATFKELPEDLLKEYLNKIRQRFHPTDANIADMLGVSPGSLSMLLKKYKLNAVYDQKAIRDLGSWNAWLAGEDISLVVPNHSFFVDDQHQVPKHCDRFNISAHGLLEGFQGVVEQRIHPGFLAGILDHHKDLLLKRCHTSSKTLSSI